MQWWTNYRINLYLEYKLTDLHPRISTSISKQVATISHTNYINSVNKDAFYTTCFTNNLDWRKEIYFSDEDPEIIYLQGSSVKHISQLLSDQSE